MAEHEDTSVALRRLEAALNRIAAQVARPRPASPIRTRPDQDAPADDSQLDEDGHIDGDGQDRHEIVTELDNLIIGLRSALGIERQS
jgi:hypothetical protein